MKTIQKILLWLMAVGFFGITGFQNANANHDYVCSSYTTACNCTWDADWTIEDGKAVKYCRWTTEQIIRIWNTRVWCPSNDARWTWTWDWSLNWTQWHGWYRYGFTAPAAKACILRKYDTVAPVMAVSKSLVMGQVDVPAYRKLTTTRIFKWDDCDINVVSDILDGKKVKDDCRLDRTETDTDIYEKSWNSCFESHYYYSSSKRTVQVECSDTTVKANKWIAYAAKVTSVNDNDEVLYKTMIWDTWFEYVKDSKSWWIAKNFGQSWVDPSAIPAPKQISLWSDTDMTVCDRWWNCTTCNTWNNKCTTTSGSNTTVRNTEFDNASDEKIPPSAQIEYTEKGTNAWRPVLWCVNKDVKVQIRCTWDVWSWCRAAPENADYVKSTTVIWNKVIWTKQDGTQLTTPIYAPKYYSFDFTSTTNWIWIMDVAGNITTLPYSVDWIDQNEPILTNITWLTDNMKLSAGQETKFSFTATDERDGWSNKTCSNELEYELRFIDTVTNNPATIFVKNSTGIYVERTWVTWTLTWNTINIEWEEDHQEYSSGDVFYKTKDIWTYRTELIIRDNAWNQVTRTFSDTTLHAGNVDNDETEIVLIWSAINARCANNHDSYEYKVTFRDEYGNPIAWKKVIWIEQVETNPSNTIKVDMTDRGSDDAVNEDYNASLATNSAWELTFELKSLAPWIFEQTFNINVPTWNLNYINTWNKQIQMQLPWTKDFTRPYSWFLSLEDWGWLKLWTTQRLVLNFNNECFNGAITEPIDKKAENFESTLHMTVPSTSSLTDFNWTTKQEVAHDKVDTRIDYVWAWALSDDDNPWMRTTPYITYTLWGKKIRCYLGETTDPNDNDIELGWTWFFWVRVIGTMQWDGKQMTTGQDWNYTDFTLSTLRTDIKKKAYELIKWQTSNTISTSKVRYVEWDVTVGWEISLYETLIVKNWNVIVNSNLNSSNNKFGIIVLNENLADKTKWNIYIKPNITKLNAVMYTDWSLLSVNASWIPYFGDSSERTNDLQNQLTIIGSTFTRNTIGWAILWWTWAWSYKLPGGATTTDFDEAMKYDLNYLRRWVNWCELIPSTTNCVYANPLVVKYDASLQVNPPVWFSK